MILGHYSPGRRRSDVAIPLADDCLERRPDLRARSSDRGFRSPVNRDRFDGRLETATLPGKGRLNKDDLAR